MMLTRFPAKVILASVVSAFLSLPVRAATGDNAPPIPASYTTSHPRLPVPDSAFLAKLASNPTALSRYNAAADAWDSANPGNSTQLRQLLIAYMANKIAQPTKAATYLGKIKALANLGGTWGPLLYSVDDGLGNGTYTLTSASANFLTGCGGSCVGNVVSIEARTFAISSVPNANTVVLNPSNPAPTGSNLKIRIFSYSGVASLNIALIYDWLYNDLDSATRTEFLTELEVLCTEWEETYNSVGASPYNDVFYLNVGPFGLIGALAIYPDHPNGITHLRFMTDVWFNVLLPVWSQVFGTEGGGWHESWPDYVNSSGGSGLTQFLVPSMLSWQAASGDPIFARKPWLKNFAYLTMYMTKPDYLLENIGDTSRPYLTPEYTITQGAGLGSLNGLAEIYNDPVLRGWARTVNGEAPTGPDGFEPSAWPFYTPDTNSNAVADRSGLPRVRNFSGWGLLSMRSGWSEDDTFATLKYGDNFWSHEHLDTGAFTIFTRGNLAIDSGSYRAGYSSKHENQYARQTIAHNTLTVTDPADVYSTTFSTTDELGNSVQLPLPNDGGQRRTGSPYNERFPQFVSPGVLGGWLQHWNDYHTGQVVALSSAAGYTYTAVDITAAYNNQSSATAPTASNRTNRVQKAVRHMVFIPRGTAAYVIVFDQVTSTNASFVKRWLLHSVNQPTVSGNSFQIVRSESVIPKPYISLWLGNYQSSLKYASGSGASLQYQYGGKLYGWMLQPQSAAITVVGGPGKEFWVADPLKPGTGTNWNQCQQGQCAANTEGLGTVNDMISPDPTTAPHEPGSWRIEESPTSPATQDYFLNVMLATTAADTSVPVNVTAPSGLAAGTVGATWTEGGKTYTVTFPQNGVGGHITIAGANGVDEDLLAHAQQLPGQLQIASGSGQTGTTGAPLPAPLAALVEDAAGNVMPNAVVHFAVTQGNGYVSSETAVSDAAGHASVTFTLGAGSVGAIAKVMAAVNGLAPVEFSATVGSAGTPALTSVSCAPSALNSGTTSACTVSLAQAAGSGGATVTLSSNLPVLTVPASVPIPAGSMSATFTATAGVFSIGQTAIVTASLNGASVLTSLTLVVSSATTLSSVSCAPASLVSGTTSICTVALSQAAAAGGVSVALASSATLLTVPVSVTVPAGSSTATFQATAGTVVSSLTAIVTAALGGASQVASIVLLPPSASTSGWQELPNTTLQAVCPANNFGGSSYLYNYYCHNVVDAWSSAVLDTTRNRLIIWGGGHADYSGNEVYSLNLGASPATLTRLNDPSVFDASGSCPDSNVSDGTPVSRHTYNNLVYMPTVDRMFTFTGSKAPCGSASTMTYTLDFSVSPPKWHAMDPVNGFNPVPGFFYPYSVCAWDPNSLSVICNATGTFLRYNPVSNTYTSLATSQNVPYTASGVIDPKRKLFIFMGVEYQSTVPHVVAVDISSGSSFTVQDWSSQVSGCDALAGANYPGLAYDPVSDRIVGWPNSGNTVYVFNPDAKTCVAQTFANGPQGAAPVNTAGTFGRFQYAPALGAFALLPKATLNAFLLRMDTGQPTASPCDVNGDGVLNSADVDSAVAQALGTLACTTASLVQPGTCSVVDVERVIIAVLGGACVTGSH